MKSRKGNCIDKSTARAILYLFMSCYKAGLKDAENVRDDALCEEFKATVREPGVFGRVINDYTVGQKSWRIDLLYINGNRASSTYAYKLLKYMDTVSSIISCVLPISQEFYIQGLDDFNSYPYIYDFDFIDNNRLIKWTNKGIIKASKKDIIIDIQKYCMDRARIDEVSDSKFAINRRNYDFFATQMWNYLNEWNVM